MIYAKVGESTILYTGDYNMTPDRHLGAAQIDRLPLDLVITEYAAYVLWFLVIYFIFGIKTNRLEIYHLLSKLEQAGTLEKKHICAVLWAKKYIQELSSGL